MTIAKKMKQKGKKVFKLNGSLITHTHHCDGSNETNNATYQSGKLLLLFIHKQIIISKLKLIDNHNDQI